MSSNGFLDGITTEEEIRDTNRLLDGISDQLERLGGGPSEEDEIGHIAVPGDTPAIQVPSGEVTINLEQGTVAHEDVGVLRDELTTIGDLFDESTTATPRRIQNIVFNADTVATLQLQQGNGQRVPLQYVPLPTEAASEIVIQMGAPGSFFLLASTQRLPIGLGAVTATAQRVGTASGVLDSLTSVPVAPHRLLAEFGPDVAEARVFASTFDTSTITVDNDSGNGNDVRAVVEARESATALSEWREIASDTVPDGDHSVFQIVQRHERLRTRVTNTTNGETVSATVEFSLANP